MSGEELVPAGPLYFNALVEQRPERRGGVPSPSPVLLGDGRVTIKEEIGVNTIFQSRGAQRVGWAV